MSQAQLGALVGVTRQTMIAVEQGAFSPTLETALRIAHALGRPLDEVFFFPMEDAWSTRPISTS
jgi:putative transcriptional regulator